jgi:integrase
MKKPDLPYLEFKTIKGRHYIYFRRGASRVRLPGNPDSEEFMREYWAVRSGRNSKPIKTTWNALIVDYYRSPEYLSKAPGTKANYRRHCEAIREKNGDKDVRRFRRKHAIAARDSLAGTWSKANERLAVLSILLKRAVDLEWIDRNPTADIAKLTGGEYEAWPDDTLEAFERYCVRNELTTARTVFELCVGTGQRLGDCIKMAWEDFDGEFMAVVQEKTGARIWIYCPARLQRYLATLPRSGRHILSKNLTEPIGKRAAQKAVEEVRETLGIMRGEKRLVPHGWRYTAARLLAEAGCSDSEIQAVTGHKTLAMVQKYRAQASQKAASKRAQERRNR